MTVIARIRTTTIVAIGCPGVESMIFSNPFFCKKNFVKKMMLLCYHRCNEFKFELKKGLEPPILEVEPKKTTRDLNLKYFFHVESTITSKCMV